MQASVVIARYVASVPPLIYHTTTNHKSFELCFLADLPNLITA